MNIKMTENQIVECEIAKSDRAKCHNCGSKIPAGTPRIYFYMNWKKRIKDKKNFKTPEYVKEQGGTVPWVIPIKRTICHKCSNMVLDYDIEKQKQEIQRLRKIKKQFNTKMALEKIQELIRNSEMMEVLEK